MTEATAHPDSLPQARADVVFRSVSGDWVLYDPRTQDLHVLNVTAAAVWLCCDGTLDLDAIARHLVEEMEDAPPFEVVRQDVAEAVARFRADGLLE